MTLKHKSPLVIKWLTHSPGTLVILVQAQSGKYTVPLMMNASIWQSRAIGPYPQWYVKQS